MLRAIMVGLVLLGLSAGSAAAQSKPAGPCKLGKLAELPIRMEGLRPLVNVEINGEPVRLILDSGAFFSSIDGPTATRLGMKPGALPPGMTVRGAGGAADYKVGRARTFKFDQAEFKNVDFLVGGPSAGMSDGLLGQNLLGKVDVEYDFANGVVRLFRAEGCKNANFAYWAGDKAVQMLRMDASDALRPHHVTSAKVSGRPVKVMFDTGASTSILKRSTAARIGFDPADPRVESAGVGRGVGRGGFEAWLAPFDSFEIGGEQVRNTRLRVADFEAGQDMILGADFFLAHRIFVVNSQDTIFFTHNGGPVFRLESGVRSFAAAEDAQTDLPDAGAYSRRAAASAARFDFARAVADLDKAVSLAPDDADHYYDRATVRVRAQQYALAMEDLEKALALRPTHVKSLLARGGLNLRRREPAKARADFDEARRLSLDDYDVRLQIASAYTAAGAFDAAIGEYDAWIAAHPRDPHMPAFLNARCWARGLWGRELNKALEDCNSSARMSRDSNVIDSRAMVYLRMGDFERSVREYDAALRLQPKSAWSLYGRGLAKLRLGRTEEGQADLAASKAIDPELPEQAARYGLAP